MLATMSNSPDDAKPLYIMLYGASFRVRARDPDTWYADVWADPDGVLVVWLEQVPPRPGHVWATSASFLWVGGEHEVVALSAPPRSKGFLTRCDCFLDTYLKRR